MAEVDRVVGNDDKMRGEAWRDARAAFDAGFGIETSEKIAVADIMAVTRDGAASARRFSERPAAGVRAGAERLRPPLHLLHHPLWPRQFALGADGRGGRSGPRAGRARPCRDRADRRRPHELRRRPAGHAEARATDKADFAACAGTEAPADFVDRFHRGRSRSARRHRRRRAADAASASVAAVRRRHDPEADEAAAFARRMRSNSARRCGGCGRTSRSAPTSSRAFRPRPRRCSRARRIWSRNAISPSCTCFPTRSVRARRRRGCRRSRGEAIKERAKRLRAAGEAALRKRLAAEIGATRQVLIESGKQGRTEHFLPVAIAGETPGAVRALTITGHDGARLTV